MKHQRIVAWLVGVLAVLTTAASAHAQFSISIAPPTLRAEVRTEQPSPRDVWIGGSWQVEGGQYVWAPGRWAAPQQPGQTWQDERWNHRGAVWVSTPGRWVSDQPAGVYVVAPEAPPRARFERRGDRPDPDHVWVPGYWQWDSHQYGWVPGRWETPEQDGSTWVRPRWQHRGHGWRFYGGGWRDRGMEQPQQPQQPRVVYVQQPAPPPQVVVQPAPPPRVVYVQQPAPPPQVVVQPAPPPRVVYVQQPAPPPQVVIVQRPPQVVVQPPNGEHDEGHGDHGHGGHGDWHDNGRNH